MNKSIPVILIAAFAAPVTLAAPSITDVTAQQRYPWNGKVDITYTVSGDIAASLPDASVASLKVTATDGDTGQSYTASSLSGDTSLADGTHSVVWDMGAQGLDCVSTNVVFSVSCETTPATYCVIDLAAGANATAYPVTYLAEPPSGGFNVDAYKTTKLVLKRLEAGTFKMQGSSNVTLTKPFFIGLFEVTQKQWSLVTGSNPSNFSGDKLPVEKVSYNAIRGSTDGAKWPASNAVDASSFLGKLRARTGLDFDLPTEAQWEYACRAGTTTTYSYGNSASGDYMWYSSNSSSKTHEVGTKQPNPWGFYDMHGNVAERCLDWYGTLAYGLDPRGAPSGTDRAKRGGSWNDDATICTSSYRDWGKPSDAAKFIGFRLAQTCLVETTWYVDAKAGNDNNGGVAWFDAKKTIQSAINLADDGDVILVKPGEYAKLTNARGVNVLVKSLDGPVCTVIDSGGAGRAVTGMPSDLWNVWKERHITLDGFTLQNGRAYSASAAAYVFLRNCIIRNNLATSSSIFDFVNLEGCLIADNVCSNNLLVYRSSMVNCTMADNRIVNQTTGAAIGMAAITNCVIFEAGCGSASVISRDSTVAYSCLDEPNSGEGNIVSSIGAVFADVAHGDYRLSANSPCIEAGAPDSQAMEFDLDGNPRLKGRFVDMGCYEFQSPFPASPVITPSGGVAASWPLSISMFCETDGAAIHYTTDGSEPTEASPAYRRFRISERTTVKAVALKNGLYSEIAVAEYATGQCADPVITPADGTEFEHVGQSVSIAWQSEDGVLRYTTDGSDPTAESPIYNGPFTIDDSTVVKAKAFGDQFFDSAIVTANLTRVWVNVATPAIAAASSFTGSETKVELSCATPGATIRYTLNGNDPNSHATRYTGPFYVADSCTVKAYATCYDYLDSAVATQSIEKVWGIGDTVGAPDHTFTTGGDLPFVRVTDTTAPLGESMKSGAITHSQTSTLSTTVMGPGTISFQWKTSCEKDPDDLYEWDHAEFSLDGTVVARLDGESGWQTVTQAISGDGPHTLEWRYVKDDMESEGEDCCWVADYRWGSAYTATQTTPAPVPYAWLRGFFPHTPDEYDAYEAAAKDGAANGQNTVWECYVAGLNPTDETAAFHTIISIGADGEPVVGWEPRLSAEEEAKRTYTIYGRESLTDGDWGPTNAASRFFRVKVSMP